MSEETIDDMLERHNKEFEEASTKLELTDDAPTTAKPSDISEEKKADVDTSKKEIKKEISINDSLGYDEYDRKNKNSDRIQYVESEIEITEEDV